MLPDQAFHDGAPILTMDFSDRTVGRPGFIHGGGHRPGVRAGRRIANVRAEAWQSDRDKPLASSWMNFLLKLKG